MFFEGYIRRNDGNSDRSSTGALFYGPVWTADLGRRLSNYGESYGCLDFWWLNYTEEDIRECERYFENEILNISKLKDDYDKFIVYAKKYYQNLAAPNNGPLGGVKNNLRRHLSQ